MRTAKKPWIVLCLCIPSVSVACEGPHPGPVNARSAPVPAVDDPQGKRADLTPELIAKAESILEASPNAPMGSEVRFEANGKKYVARVEQHDNDTHEAGRPPGKHKGITIYEAD